VTPAFESTICSRANAPWDHGESILSCIAPATTSQLRIATLAMEIVMRSAWMALLPALLLQHPQRQPSVPTTNPDPSAACASRRAPGQCFRSFVSVSEACTADLQEKWRIVLLENEEGSAVMAHERARGRNADRLKMCWFAITVPRRLLDIAREFYPACDPANASEIERVEAYADKAAAFVKSNCWNRNLREP
jgi:hypothetical protein